MRLSAPANHSYRDRQQPCWWLSRSAGPAGASAGEIRPLRISQEPARELLRVLREEDLELPEDSTAVAVGGPHPVQQPPPPERPEDGIEGLALLMSSVTLTPRSMLPSTSTSTSTATGHRRHRCALCGDGATRPQPRLPQVPVGASRMVMVGSPDKGGSSGSRSRAHRG